MHWFPALVCEDVSDSERYQYRYTIGVITLSAKKYFKESTLLNALKLQPTTFLHNCSIYKDQSALAYKRKCEKTKIDSWVENAWLWSGLSRENYGSIPPEVDKNKVDITE